MSTNEISNNESIYAIRGSLIMILHEALRIQDLTSRSNITIEIAMHAQNICNLANWSKDFILTLKTSEE